MKLYELKLKIQSRKLPRRYWISIDWTLCWRAHNVFPFFFRRISPFNALPARFIGQVKERCYHLLGGDMWAMMSAASPIICFVFLFYFLGRWTLLPCILIWCFEFVIHVRQASYFVFGALVRLRNMGCNVHFLETILWRRWYASVKCFYFLLEFIFSSYFSMKKPALNLKDFISIDINILVIFWPVLSLENTAHRF